MTRSQRRMLWLRLDIPYGLLQCQVILSSLQVIRFIRLCMIRLSLLQDVDVTWISHIIVPHDQSRALGKLVTIRYLPQIYWHLGAVAPLCLCCVLLVVSPFILFDHFHQCGVCTLCWRIPPQSFRKTVRRPNVKKPVILGERCQVARGFHAFSDPKWLSYLEPQNPQNHRVANDFWGVFVSRKSSGFPIGFPRKKAGYLNKGSGQPKILTCWVSCRHFSITQIAFVQVSIFVVEVPESCNTHLDVPSEVIGSMASKGVVSPTYKWGI